MDMNNFNELINVDDSYKAPARLMSILLGDIPHREEFFQNLIALDSDLSQDTLQHYYEDEQAQRGQHKQDYTPTSISKLGTFLTELDAQYGSRYDSTAGTGSMLIQYWWTDCLREPSPVSYTPSDYLYVGQELSDRAIPFLLTNMMMRGMNGVVIQGDTLTMVCKGVYFVQNDKNDALAFSNLNVMPYTEQVREFFNIHEWVPEEERLQAHIESPLHIWIPECFKAQLEVA